jgi:hypothetical protein
MSITKSQESSADVAALLRARNPLLWVITREEAGIEQCLIQAAAAAGYKARTWDVAQGVTDLQGERETVGGSDPADTLNTISARAATGSDRCVWIMRDLPIWLTAGDANLLNRLVRNKGGTHQNSRCSARSAAHHLTS